MFIFDSVFIVNHFILSSELNTFHLWFFFCLFPRFFFFFLIIEHLLIRSSVKYLFDAKFIHICCSLLSFIWLLVFCVFCVSHCLRTKANSFAIVSWRSYHKPNNDRLSQIIARSKKRKINIYKVQSVRWMPNVDLTSDQFTNSMGTCALYYWCSFCCLFSRLPLVHLVKCTYSEKYFDIFKIIMPSTINSD